MSEPEPTVDLDEKFRSLACQLVTAGETIIRCLEASMTRRTIGVDPEALENQERANARSLERIDLDALAVWCQASTGTRSTQRPYIKPSDVQSTFRLTWNAACSALEALEARGDLDRVPGPALAWRPARQGPRLGKTPSGGYALPLSSKEHGALLRLLDWHAGMMQRHGQFSSPADMKDDRATLRAVRSRLWETT